YTKYIREAIKLRYTLVPYLYSLLFEASTEGDPVMRPLVYEFENDKKVSEESFDFMFGSFILVANVLERGAKTRKVYLPEGAAWFDWNTKQVYEGGQTIEVEVALNSIPMFIRSGAIIPISEGLMNIHHDSIDKLKFLIEPSEESSFVLYEDDGITNNYKNGEYLKTLVSVKKTDGVKITFEKEGNYNKQPKEINIDLICRDVAPVQICLKDIKLPMLLDKKQWELSEEGWYFDTEQRIAKIKYPNLGENYDLHVNFSVKDLISI
ncbi:MAG: glycoside hydrolase family 31 protein, partial [Paenibacillus macerans]|nr:glycoside hydrolase family 31 protein [Paenibacillus macerans]